MLSPVAIKNGVCPRSGCSSALMQQATWRTSLRASVENVWHVESCVTKTDIHLLWGNMLTKERTFVLKTYHATCSYRHAKEAFHTEFLNSATTLSDSSILRRLKVFRTSHGREDCTQRWLWSTSSKHTSWSHRIHTHPLVDSLLVLKPAFVHFSEFHLDDLCFTL